jgi:hypothetical protein
MRQFAVLVTQLPEPPPQLLPTVMQTGSELSAATGENPAVAGETVPSSRWKLRLLSLYPSKRRFGAEADAGVMRAFPPGPANVAPALQRYPGV